VVIALSFSGSVAISRAAGPEDSTPPLVLYALAPDSAAAPTGPVATAPEPAASALTPESSTSASSAGVVALSASLPTTPATATRKANTHTVVLASTKPPATHASATDEATRAKAELERTEAILRPVKTKVVRSFNKKAREEFGTATARQKEAREAFAENLYARAERLTLEARSLARAIAVHLGPPEDDADYVAMTLDRTDDALKRAREVLQESGSAEERDQLTALERRQKESRRFLREGGTRKAYASTRDVRDGVLTLLRDCDDLPVPEETAAKALKRASRSLEQAKGELGERLNAAANRLAQEARAQMAKARAAFARKNYRDTLLHSKLVERNLELAVSAQRSATNRSG